MQRMKRGRRDAVRVAWEHVAVAEEVGHGWVTEVNEMARPAIVGGAGAAAAARVRH